MPLRTHSSPGSLPRAGVPLDLTTLPPLLLMAPLPATLVSLPFFLSCKFSFPPRPQGKPAWAQGPQLVQFSSVTQSCLTLGDPMDCSTPGLPVHHQLSEFTQTHAHRVGDAIQPSHLLPPPSPPALQHQGFSNAWVLHIRWSKNWSFSFSITWAHCPGQAWGTLVSWTQDPPALVSVIISTPGLPPPQDHKCVQGSAGVS